jgi:hypothetical protein
MSDDTPTVRFPENPAAQNTGAQNPGAQRPAAQTPGLLPSSFQRPPTRQRPERPSRGPLVLFVILAILVVAAIVVLLVILDGRLASSSQPVPSTSATTPASASSAPPTPSGAATTAPPPVQPAGTFSVFVVPEAQGGCGRHGAPTVMVTWATQHAKSVWIADGSSDAKTSGGVELPLSGSQQNVPDSFTINCGQREDTFTITLVGDNGGHVSKTWMIRVDGHRF